MAFLQEIALPALVRGPVELRALRRLAAILRGESGLGWSESELDSELDDGIYEATMVSPLWLKLQKS